MVTSPFLDHTKHIFSESLSSGDDNDQDKDLQKDKYKDTHTDRDKYKVLFSGVNIFRGEYLSGVNIFQG